MAFVNERVSAPDVAKYGLEEINRRAFKDTFEYFWTIDREKNVYLRWMESNRDDPAEQTFSFYWKGHLLPIRLRIVHADGQRGGTGSTTWALARSSLNLPADLSTRKNEIIDDLKDALRAFKDFGPLSSVSDHTAYFEF